MYECWTFEEAQSNFSGRVEAAVDGAPQFLTAGVQSTLVLITTKEYDQLKTIGKLKILNFPIFSFQGQKRIYFLTIILTRKLREGQ